MQRTRSRSRWVKWTWRVVALLPGASTARWKRIRGDGDSTTYHAATLTLELWPSDTEAYLMELSSRNPSAYVVFANHGGGDPSDIEFVLVTASPYEAQDYLDSGEEEVERVAMPPTLVEILRDFCRHLHVDEKFVKRRRDRVRVDKRQDGVGDARVRQLTDVYRSPSSLAKE
ncbi:MAG: DUF3305 domain-containing protein [Rhodobacteraceae bacterium]|nr:DUF3305 domain-containing protein [Paracoccaceae bacterium]